MINLGEIFINSGKKNGKGMINLGDEMISLGGEWIYPPLKLTFKIQCKLKNALNWHYMI